MRGPVLEGELGEDRAAIRLELGGGEVYRPRGGIAASGGREGTWCWRVARKRASLGKRKKVGSMYCEPKKSKGFPARGRVAAF